MKSDSLFYKYFQLLPEALLLLAGEDISRIRDTSTYRFQSVEIKDLSFRLDGVLAKADFKDMFYFAEVQYQKDKRLYRRIFAEIMVFLYQHNPRGNWRVVVIFPKRNIDAGVPQDLAEYVASGRLKIVYLEEIAPELLQEFPLSLVQILTAKPTKSNVQTALQQAMAAHTDMLDDVEFTRFLLRIISEKLPKLTFEEIKAMIGPTLVKFEDTQFYKDLQAKEQEVMQRALQKGLQEGLHKGLQEGLQEGLHKGLQEGLYKGNRQRQEAVAHKMLRMGMSLEQIAEATDLSIDEVWLLAQ